MRVDPIDPKFLKEMADWMEKGDGKFFDGRWPDPYWLAAYCLQVIRERDKALDARYAAGRHAGVEEALRECESADGAGVARGRDVAAHKIRALLKGGDDDAPKRCPNCGIHRDDLPDAPQEQEPDDAHTD